MYAQTIIIIILIVMELDHSLISVSCLGIHKAPPVNHKIRYYILVLDITTGERGGDLELTSSPEDGSYDYRPCRAFPAWY